jgi:mono/diheme cytochrome c family protein
MTHKLSLFLLSSLLSGCTGALPAVTADTALLAQTLWPDATQAQLEQGRSMYVARCGGCHALVPPARRSPDQWRSDVSEMAPKARLSQEESLAVLRYLVTANRPTGATR